MASKNIGKKQLEIAIFLYFLISQITLNSEDFNTKYDI